MHPEVERLKKRTEARLAAGLVPDYTRGRKSFRKSLPCVYVGRELTGLEREARGKDHRRKWLFCLHPETPLGEVVCRCVGCNSTCPGYTSPG